MTAQQADVAVIGGGLSGCAAAIHLAKRGYHVALFEAQTYPHHKVCGEFLSPECGRLLDDLGLSTDLQSAGAAQIKTVRIITPNGTVWSSPLPAAGIGISRYTLDKLLVDQARRCGVDVHTGTAVNDVQGTLAEGFVLTARGGDGQANLKARSVVGAHGKRSSIDRKLNRSFFQKPQPFVGLKAHFRGYLPPDVLHLYSFPGGYCGMSAIENGQINVCLLVREAVFQAASQPLSDRVEGFVAWMKKQNPALGHWFDTAEPLYDRWLSISQIPFVRKQVVVNDVLMAGDAAGLIAPVAGDGMGMALQTGELVSVLLDGYLAGQLSASQLRDQYEKRWWQTFGLRLRLSRVLQAFMLRPDWLAPGLALMNAAPALGQLLITHTRDKQLVHP